MDWSSLTKQYNSTRLGELMITYDFEERPITLEELLRLANEDAVRVIRSDGQEFIIAPADTFEQEVARLGNSKRFMRFLASRSKNRTGHSLEEIERDLHLGRDG
jgi:hypothetical protein